MFGNTRDTLRTRNVATLLSLSPQLGASDTDTTSTSGTVAGSDVGVALRAHVLLSSISIAPNFASFLLPSPFLVTQVTCFTRAIVGSPM